MGLLNKKSIVFIIICVSIFSLIGCSNKTPEVVNTLENNSEDNGFTIVDDMGKEIYFAEPAKKIISLYSAHTENMFELGLNEEIVGVSTSDIYPVDALSKETFSYKDDAEKIISINPDVVVIRPFINRNYPDFVEILETGGIKVVSLYSETYEGFDDYIKKLAKITGKENEAELKLAEFHKNIDEIYEKTKKVENKVNVYFESTEKDYRTITPDSMASNAIKFAGGVNIASDVEPIKEGSSIAEYGEEKLLSKANEIDVYISQVGAMNAGGNPHSVSIRPGFDTIKAVKENRIYVIDQKIVSSATFRYYKGINELSRMFYPEVFANIEEFRSDENASRKDIAKMVVMKKNKSFYIPSSKYYDENHDGHTYGFFKDVDYRNEYFDYIETAVMAGYIEGIKENSEEFFKPEEFLTRDDFAKLVFKMGDFQNKGKLSKIMDLQQCENAKIIQNLVDNSILNTKDGNFNPDVFITYNEIIDAFNKF